MANQTSQQLMKDPRVDLDYFSDNGGGRTQYLKWEDYFMALTLLVERRCEDKCQTKAGASIFDETRKFVAIGNTSKIHHKVDIEDAECHAELNAVLNRNSADLKNSTMYVSYFPCNECAKYIIQSGIKSVVYYADKKEKTEATQKEENDKSPNGKTEANQKGENDQCKDSKYMLQEAEVNFKPFQTFLRQITIDFRGKDPEDGTSSQKDHTLKKNEAPNEKTEATQKEENDPNLERDEAEVNFKGKEPQDGSQNDQSPKENEDEEFFMAMAFVASARSKDPRTQVGACIVNIVNERNQVVGIGYNGMPLGFIDANTNWGKDDKDGLTNKDRIVCHAEMNAVLFGNVAEMQNSTLFVTLFPCEECAKVVIRAGIKKVVYYSDKKHAKNTVSRDILKKAKVKTKQFTPTPGREKIVIDIKPLDKRCT
uniref:dCMP deaminase n=1 Tax=Crassostrea virginica TaxID=6565 RepID=A0A8B8DCN6_CRAVI|nr:cytidine and dCMP deaminase domain-containing protein 1-like [Crassostrea virginica]